MSIKYYSAKNDGDKYVSKNFQVKEFACHDGTDRTPIDTVLVLKLQELRDKIGAPLIISSGYRSESYNRKIGGAKFSYHIYGKAADVYCNYYSAKDIAHWAQPLWLNGIGLYTNENFVHLDVRRDNNYWLGHGQTAVDTFGNIPSFKISDFKNLKMALCADGWDTENLTTEYDNTLDWVLKYCQIRVKSKGNATKLVQNAVGVTPDGIAGTATRAGIIQWQKNNGLVTDGIFGYNCWKRAIETGF